MEQLLAASPCSFSSTAVTACSTNLFSPRTRLGRARVVRRVTIVSKLSSLQPGQRRSANYHPSVWEPAVIESLTTPFSYEAHGARLEDLKNEARNLLEYAPDPCSTLKLIDSLQRLGVSYHFGKEIDAALDNLISSKTVVDDLYTTSLMFRILREHGYPISTDVFDKFRGGDGKFMESLGCDAAALLSLYEASHLGTHGEDVMEEAMKFSAEHLQSSLREMDCDMAMQVQHTLQVPLRWRMPRIEAMSYIHAYQKHGTSHSALIELAKLDYNLVQAVYQQELRELARWWGALGFKEKVSFSRDRLMENYIWAMGIVFEPQLSTCRTNLTRFVCILTAIDDMYDVYGTLPELELFTEAVNRWDITAMKDLPEYMGACYLALLDFVNDLELEILKDHGSNTTHYIKEEASSK
ncbi:terpene synthase 03 [Hibiscus trionum]|uniref:Terpene synthase 03 n=1 Tax=Hibiscus trionum TaxID=183268 RepID=A0A9W7J6U4_HIBTR|nr:terpene synthase 03 [Hibiscus trionum]